MKHTPTAAAPSSVELRAQAARLRKVLDTLGPQNPEYPIVYRDWRAFGGQIEAQSLEEARNA